MRPTLLIWAMASNLDVLSAVRTSADVAEYQQLLRTLAQPARWSFEVVPHVFRQSSQDTDDTSFDYLREDFGIEMPWPQVQAKLDHLNAQLGPDEQYKIVFMARHGQGFHNVAHDKYGDDAWNEHWSKLNGDGTMVWGPDPDLTTVGKAQAVANHDEWRRQLRAGAPRPTRLYLSPLSRSLDTHFLTWGSAERPLVMENLRETYGVHTCDKRAPARVLRQKYAADFEDGFAEEDPWYRDDERELVAHHAMRINQLFQDIFNAAPQHAVISTTTHSGSIRAALLVLGHRPFTVATGGMIPVFVRACRA